MNTDLLLALALLLLGLEKFGIGNDILTGIVLLAPAVLMLL